MKVGICLCVLGAAAAAPPTWEGLGTYAWATYKADFGKGPYAAGEDAARRALFEARLAAIRTHNAAGASTYKKGVNALTDRTDDERRALGGRDRAAAAAARGRAALLHAPSGAARPASFDWRDHRPSVVTAVKDQGSCGSCWAFASTETIESHVALNTGELLDLSPQHLVSCAANAYDCGGTGGCGGSISELAFEYVQTHGLASEWHYPYTSGGGGATGTCAFNATAPIKAAATVDGYRRLPSNDEAAVLDALVNQGPLAVNVDASAWSDYESGIFDGCSAAVDIDHVVQLVGYGTDYLLIRNSWTPNWGENGYIRLKRTSACGVDAKPLDGTSSPVFVCVSCVLVTARA